MRQIVAIVEVAESSSSDFQDSDTRSGVYLISFIRRLL